MLISSPLRWRWDRDANFSRAPNRTFLLVFRECSSSQCGGFLVRRTHFDMGLCCCWVVFF